MHAEVTSQWRGLLQVPVELLDVVLLVEDRGHVGRGGGCVPGAGAGLQAELRRSVPASHTERVPNLGKQGEYYSE